MFRLVKSFLQRKQPIRSTTLSTQVSPVWLVINLYEKVHSVYRSLVVDKVGDKHYNALYALNCLDSVETMMTGLTLKCDIIKLTLDKLLRRPDVDTVIQ